MEPDPKLIVRRVMPVDLRATAELLAAQLEARGTAGDLAELRNAAQSALENPSVLVIGAYHEGLPGFAHGKMVGVLLMNVLASIKHLGEIGWIETLFVRPAYRRKGLAARMLAQTLDWGGTRGLRRIDLEVSDEHEVEAATRLYRNFGFEAVERSRLTRALP
jgi:GNAT superfamily N-acetyltransferase